MKRWLLALAVLFVWSGSAQAQNPNAFHVESFKAEYWLDEDERGIGRMAVQETIAAEFPSIDQNHGILRAIPKIYRRADLNLDINGVRDEDGREYPFTTYSENDNLVLKIGDAGTFVHGRTVYVIDYQLSNVITFFDGHDELFWNVNGTQWSQPFGSVTAVVHVPDKLIPALRDQQRCFSGPAGSTNSGDCQMERVITSGGLDITISAQDLAPTENLSFVLAFNQGTFFKDPWPARQRLLQAASGVLPPVAILGYMINRWRRLGRDPAGRGVIIPQYAPPKDFNVLTADVLINERLQTKAVSAAIIELAVSGYLKIHESQKKKLIGSDSRYSLELVKDASDLPASQQDLVKGLFSSVSAVGERVDLSTKANQLYKTVRTLNKDVPKGLWKRRYFRTNPATARAHWLGRGVLVLVIGIALVFISWTRLLGAGLAVGSAIMMLFSGAMPSRTKLGVNTRDALLGLKDYIKLAEAERLKYLQSPEGVKQYGDPAKSENKLHLFEKLLPYAMLFGLEKDWAKQFASLYTQPPEWFDSYRGGFNSMVLADSLGSFNSTATTAFSPPSSSGSSGFSGGGGSGGGGGGGGGGGW